jgi:hypothetical protein
MNSKEATESNWEEFRMLLTEIDSRNTYPDQSILKVNESSTITLDEYNSITKEDESDMQIISFIVSLEFTDSSLVYIEGLPEDQAEEL